METEELKKKQQQQQHGTGLFKMSVSYFKSKLITMTASGDLITDFYLQRSSSLV